MPRTKQKARRGGMKRTGTMAVTAEEGEAMLKEQGHKSHNKEEVETRTKKRTRDVVDEMLGPDAKKTTEMNSEDLENYKQSLRMAFRIFDSNRDGKITKTELEAAIRSLGKKPTKEKITKIMKAADKDKSGSLEVEEFVNYFISKKKLKNKEEEDEEVETKKTPKKAKKEAKKEEKPKRETPKRGAKGKKEEEKKEEPKKEEPKKEEAKKEESKKEETKESKKEEEKKEESSSGRPTMQRGLSIADFFTPFAGLHDEISNVEVDAFNNPKGRNFDLGHEKAFNIFNIILYDPRPNTEPTDSPVDLWKMALPALQAKGFTVFVAKTEEEFLNEIHNHDEAWISSGRMGPKNPSKFVDEVVKYHQSGRGICIWADNEPYFNHANLLTDKILGIKLTGNTPGDKLLKVGDGKKSGEFARHLLTTGLVTLHEGVTICYPSKVIDKTQVIGTSSNDHPCMMYVDPEEKAGPIVIDCGFTKLYDGFWQKTAGTERYVRNVAVWLLGLDHRMKINAPWKGPITSEKEVSTESMAVEQEVKA